MTDNRYYGRSKLGVVRTRHVNANLYTISIEHVCVSCGTLTAVQLAASIELHRHIIAEIKQLYGVDIPVDRKHIVGHCEINPITKPNCPGKDFPYQSILEGVQRVESDTTQDITLARGSSYHVKLTSPSKPAFTVGNGAVLQTFTGRQNGNEYIFGIRANGKPGQSTGVYADGKMLFTITVK
ncbi:N-acetylmuramoyl-L-alanine amidase [Anaeromassilibacillus senegalensis]|uniref:N-acetylmuramoyl-L-alanine amidase n=1 Tax=Anaeromassilibacillus senegalensis TaxID=1673717 RepID=UPI000682B307|nr:N-acetylmuramoyl-L-alanine amidase [Anaeromassilibacillus senegalensis]